MENALAQTTSIIAKGERRPRPAGTTGAGRRVRGTGVLALSAYEGIGVTIASRTHVEFAPLFSQLILFGNNRGLPVLLQCRSVLVIQGAAVIHMRRAFKLSVFSLAVMLSLICKEASAQFLGQTVAGSNSASSSSWLAGAHAGYNWQQVRCSTGLRRISKRHISTVR
jgi:hypothetical protein